MWRRIVIDKKLWSRRTFLILYDISAVVAAGMLALLARFNFYFYDIELKYLDELWRYLPVNILITLAIFYGFRMYHSLWVTKLLQ